MPLAQSGDLRLLDECAHNAPSPIDTHDEVAGELREILHDRHDDTAFRREDPVAPEQRTRGVARDVIELEQMNDGVGTAETQPQLNRCDRKLLISF
ncbi:hypothetical protein Acsp02_69670 [Actinoplanes sp. NBRC 103695]|nr:hypothetical protein Acsp02_69670 [Actinoplanes sp. NBRC 103695]